MTDLLLPRLAPGAAEGRRDELDDSGYHVEPVAHEHVGGHRAPNAREGGAVRRVHVRQVAEDFPLKVHLGQQHQQRVGARRDVLEQADHVLHDRHDARRDERTRVREEESMKWKARIEAGIARWPASWREMSVSGKPSFHRPSTRKGSPRAERLKKATMGLSVENVVGERCTRCRLLRFDDPVAACESNGQKVGC